MAGFRTLHLNYVAGYTGPLLFLFERTQQLTPVTTRASPGGSVFGQVQSSFGLIGEVCPGVEPADQGQILEQSSANVALAFLQ